jgi:beta-lactamase regulating signal transducer with metallopeptidase domain
VIYALRGVAISLSMFVLVYALLRIASAALARLLETSAKRYANGLSSNAWYALQVAPFLVAVGVVISFVIPAFLRFEPAVAEEEFGWPVLLLSGVCLLLLSVGLQRVWTAYTSTLQKVREWRQGSTVIRCNDIEVWETGPDSPPLVLAGLLRPKLLVSSSAARTLNSDELARAIAHETTHIKHHDNLKKLVLRLCSFPLDRTLERRWLESIEIEADQNAVSDRHQALDLASALVKASRLSVASAELATNLTSEAGSLLHRRVERLLAWDDVNASRSRTVTWFMPLAGALLLTLISVMWYQALLLQMHTLAEFLMQ